jgi:hypothetical protein
MPLEVLGPLVVIGIAFMVWLVSRMGGHAAVRFQTAADVEAAVKHLFPDVPPSAIAIAENGRAAVFMSADGRVGVLRRIADRDAISITHSAGAMRIDFCDAGFPAITMTETDNATSRAFARLNEPGSLQTAKAVA